MLLLANLPVMICVVLPCLLACKLPLAFEIVAFMSGRHRTEKTFYPDPAARLPGSPTSTRADVEHV